MLRGLTPVASLSSSSVKRSEPDIDMRAPLAARDAACDVSGFVRIRRGTPAAGRYNSAWPPGRRKGGGVLVYFGLSGAALRSAVDCPLGVNVLRNDAAAALSIACACDAQFIRVNVHSGALLTDQGLITGRAAETLRLRKQLGGEHVQIFADVLVKHAVP